MTLTHTQDPIHAIETAEILDKLRRPGLKILVACLLDESVYTKKGRLNKSAACRWLGWKIKKLEDKLAEMREILKPEFDLDIEEEAA